MSTFAGKVFVLGCGAVAQVTLPLMLKHLPMQPSVYTIMDALDLRPRIPEILEKGCKFIVGSLSPENYKTVLAEHLRVRKNFPQLSKGKNIPLSRVFYSLVHIVG